MCAGNSTADSAFRVGITRDLAAGTAGADWMGRPLAEVLEARDIEHEFLAEDVPEMSPDLVEPYDAVITGHARWTPEAIGRLPRLTLIARWGAGVDEVDLSAATRAGIIVASAPAEANRLGVAESVLAFMLALSKHLVHKHELTRQGRSAEAQQLSGGLIKDRVIGIIGLGGNGRALARFLEPLRPARMLAHDPHVPAEVGAELGAELTTLERLMRESDYVVVLCSLTEETRGMIDQRLLETMKQDAFFVNAARGPIVDQASLTHLLQAGRIAGAALDVFELEPPSPEDPLLKLDNVITTGHAIAWTEESLYECSLEACRAVERVYDGGIPAYVANPEVLEDASLQAKLARRRHNHAERV
jgi:phosphoglycerate dehydrogenase-like enzyme